MGGGERGECHYECFFLDLTDTVTPTVGNKVCVAEHSEYKDVSFYFFLISY